MRRAHEHDCGRGRLRGVWGVSSFALFCFCFCCRFTNTLTHTHTENIQSAFVDRAFAGLLVLACVCVRRCALSFLLFVVRMLRVFRFVSGLCYRFFALVVVVRAWSALPLALILMSRCWLCFCANWLCSWPNMAFEYIIEAGGLREWDDMPYCAGIPIGKPGATSRQSGNGICTHTLTHSHIHTHLLSCPSVDLSV